MGGCCRREYPSPYRCAHGDTDLRFGNSSDPDRNYNPFQNIGSYGSPDPPDHNPRRRNVQMTVGQGNVDLETAGQTTDQSCHRSGWSPGCRPVGGTDGPDGCGTGERMCCAGVERGS